MVSGRRDRDPPRDGLSTQDGGALVADGRCGGMGVDEAAGGAMAVWRGEGGTVRVLTVVCFGFVLDLVYFS
jgi:hypothetical protein